MIRSTMVVVMLFLLVASSARADSSCSDDIKAPGEIRPFTPAGTCLLALETADLNGDNLTDYLIVLETTGSDGGERSLLIITRGKDGSLRLAKRNDRAVYCSSCGGMMGDPFQGISAGRKSFSISHYGGSAWRWSVTTRFNYSRRDDTWQLVLVQTDSFHVSDPEQGRSIRHIPPRDFGKIDVADFDPKTYWNQK